ncbi:hypothetical protein [Aquimarina algicola]|uniref:DUF1611 domain-containing protein n=1 Tax=Aquimarina algicola TaxID=2589995 RepID=A0A504JFZ5_9FLAO|nr:hypothetical protein [Aquimarina algicola]TPN85430.1 hypothetical protein FHK87_15560 [Aquimarina algicola]
MKTQKFNQNNIKRTIICKDVNSNLINRRLKKTHIPRPGDVAIFKVKEIGKHTRVQCDNETNRYILPGDYIMAAFGNRYATGQIEGYIPTTLQKEYHILGQGGAIGVVKSMNARLLKVGPTILSLVGYVVDKNESIINTKEIYPGLETFNPIQENENTKVILSLGTSMDSGKTSSAGFIAKGLSRARKKVAYIKLTGTVYSKDRSFVKDHGAKISIDFSNYGFPSTYMCDTSELLDLYQTLLKDVKMINPDYIIVEIADGLLQRETHALIHDNGFMKGIYGILFSATDSMSAISGADMLSKLHHNLIGVSGLFTASPLLVNEVREKSEHNVFTKDDLMSEKILTFLKEIPKTTLIAC